MILHKFLNHIRVFFGLKRKLYGKWTIDPEVKLEAMHGLDAEQELIDILTKEIEKDKR